MFLMPALAEYQDSVVSGFRMPIIWIQKRNSAKGVFKLSKFLFRLLVFTYKIEKTSFSEKFNFTVVLPIVKYLVCLFFGYWIDEIDVWVKRITRTKKNIRSKRVKKQVLLVLDWVRSHIQNLSLLTRKTIKKKHSFLIYEFRIYSNKSFHI